MNKNLARVLDIELNVNVILGRTKNGVVLIPSPIDYIINMSQLKR